MSRAERGVVDRDADHQPEREEAVHQRLTPLGLRLREVAVDVERLRVEGEGREEDIVHLGHRPPDLVAEQAPDLELLVVQAGHLGTPSVRAAED